MKKLVCSLLLTMLALAGPVAPAAAPAPPVTDIAVVFLGSLEFQRQEYYDLAMESLTHRFPVGPYNLVLGPFSQRVFDRFSDKKGLIPGAIPPDKDLIDFAWSHSFDRVLFLVFTPPVVKSDEVAIQWENAQASLQTRAVMIDSRRKKKLADATIVQDAGGMGRSAAKHDVFEKCLEELRLRL